MESVSEDLISAIVKSENYILFQREIAILLPRICPSPMKHSLPIVFFSAILLAGCFGAPAGQPAETPPTPPPPEPVQEEEEQAPRETKNVMHHGVVKPAGISIYQQGSHRLLLEDSRFILLESDDIDLNGYVNENVEVFGDLRPTVEAGGMIMRVRSISLLDVDNPDAQADDEAENTEDDDSDVEDDPDEENDEEAEDEFDIDEEEVIDVEEENAMEDEDESAEEDVIDDETPEPTPGEDKEDAELAPLSPDIQARVELMLSQSFTTDQWTQEYCTAHIGFCIPVHRNWWYRSFGTTSSFLWHVELSSEEVINLTDGPIHVNLITGGVGSKKATDGQVRIQDNHVFGYREWTENRHFEIAAPQALEGPVRYITEHLVEFDEE